MFLHLCVGGPTYTTAVIVRELISSAKIPSLKSNYEETNTAVVRAQGGIFKRKTQIDKAKSTLRKLQTEFLNIKNALDTKKTDFKSKVDNRPYLTPIEQISGISYDILNNAMFGIINVPPHINEKIVTANNSLQPIIATIKGFFTNIEALNAQARTVLD